MSFDGTEEMLDEGDTFGNTWCPAESDLPNRKAKESKLWRLVLGRKSGERGGERPGTL